jgi:DNA-binding transcriptional ArsR family regulator
MKHDANDDDDLTAALRALAHPVRLSILRILAERSSVDCCCTDVTECLPLAQSTVSQHIKVLLDAGLIERKPRGTRNCYLVCGDRLASTASRLGTFVEALAVPAAPQVELSESA